MSTLKRLPASLLALAVLLSLHVQLASAQIQFGSSTYFAVLDEEEPISTEVLQVDASYRNSFGLVRSDGSFSISTDGDARFFSIQTTTVQGRNTGIIRTSVVFDRDTQNPQTQYTFLVTYTTPGGDSATAQVEVNLADINDNSPEFSSSVFEIFVFEETRPGANIFNITATDPDQVLVEEMLVDIGQGAQAVREVYTVANGRILFDIISGNELDHFTINSDNGTLSVASDAILDVDLIDSYNLTVMATDGGGLNDTAMVLITILDSNDNPPQIMSPRGVDVTISEDTNPGFVILNEINATDLDSGPNADISFLIVAGDITDSFTIDEQTGQIIVSASLDREQGTVVNLTVVARDHGIPAPLQDTIFIVVRLLDVNDYTPTFAESAYTVTVNEESRINTRVAQIEAIDLDEGTNGTVTYSIIEGSEEIFYIDPSTGTLFTNGTLDHEDVSSYTLLIEAVDNPSNESFQLSSRVNVTVAIGDFNDNAPIFVQSSYNASILDSTRRRTSIVQVNATDRDSGSNGEITYRVETQDPNNPFAFEIQEDTGVVFLNQRITFEDQSEYNLVVRALDGGTAFRLTADVPVAIFIHNVNENPPIFEQEAYNVTILETTRVSTVVLNVSATDEDMGLIGEIRYRVISDFDEAGSFEVNETTGDVFVNSTLDFDFRDFIFFQVEAYDGGFPEPYTDVTNITVFLIGTNDEAPSIIFPDRFQIMVPENTEPEIELVTLRDYTSDPDFGMGGEFTFELFEIYDEVFMNDSFSLNETTGLITSLRVFDREQQPDGIVVAIETTDFGTPQQSQVTNITITIDDKNDRNPFFETNTSTTVYEFMPPGIEVLSDYQAMDEDIGTNAQLRYAIFSGEGAERFVIDRDTGVIRTTEVLNKTVQLFYNLTIIACDQGVPQQLCGFGSVFIEVLDANDMIPIFSESVYIANFSENATAGTFIIQVNATDMDIGTNADIEYFLAPNTSHVDRFIINSTSGELFTDDIFDRENESVLELSVIAVDNGLVPLTGVATVQVHVLDFNDNTPTFNETSYEAFVVENSANGTLVVRVLATDEDAEFPNNAIQYSLRGNRSDVFHIDPSMGVVTVAGEVDWEEGCVVYITVVATDLGNPPRSSDVILTIYIEDVNDQAPSFLPDSLNLTILENSQPAGNGTEVGYVIAIDLDSDGNNSLVSYSVLMDFSNNKFELDSETGLVTFVKGSLNRERRDTFDLLIRATDHGSPQLHTDATLIITVLDANDFDPVFDEDLFIGSVSESASIGTSVLTLSASDTDIGSNGELRYSIPDITYRAYFTVNASTGVIYTDTNAFDFENITEYVFDVLVSDLGEPARNATSRVMIFITDANDHQPVFNQSEYSRVICENLASGTVVLRVGATDEDIENNAIIEFSILPGMGSEMFGIDNETGVLYTTSYINREDTPSFNLTIVANNSASTSPLSSEVQVLVEVSDLNDMHPTFDLVTNVFVFENTSINSTIYTLSALDGDEGIDGDVTYTLLEGNEEGYFELDSQTGQLNLLRSLDFENKAHFLLAVEATDGSADHLSNFTNVVINVLDINDNPPEFASQATGYRVTINTEVAVGSTLIAISAFDRDEVSEGELTYTLVGDNQGLFEIESTTQAVIRTAMPLQTFDGQSFSYVLHVSDSVHTNVVSLTVHFQGGNPTLPIFDARMYESTISEGASVGHTVFEFSGRVINSNSYTIVRGNPGGLFSIDSAGTVRLAVSNRLDFEEQSLYQLTVRVSNGGNDTYAILNVAVTDVNEHTPEFVSQSIFIALPETTPSGEPFFTVMATDDDGAAPANEVEYSIVSSDANIVNTFQINSRTGALSLRRDGALNYEFGQRNFTFTVSASDRATPRYTSEAVVRIEVINGNSYAPVFDQSRYTVELLENATVGVNIVNVSATDQDMGSSGVITYGLHGNHRYLDFRIDTFTGQIFINSDLDFERQTLYSLEVIASDGGNPNRFTVETVEIQIRDINDNTPIWEQDMYSGNVIENATLGSFVIQVRASDIDQVDFSEINGVTVFYNRNGYVSYSITQGDTVNNFEIDPDTGVVSVASTLDREQFAEYNLTLNATDGGGRYANAYLHIVTRDVNDETPIFTQDPYVVNLPENTNNGTLILTVEATDTDLFQNSEIVYQFEDAFFDYYDESLTFFLNDTTGEIFLQTPIDREEINFYPLTVYAIDMGEVPLTGVAEIQINVLDINEFAPLFTQDEFSGEVFENEPIGIQILQVNATDMDFEENSTVLYSFISGNELQLFNIDASSGLVTVANDIDFEQGSLYELVVMATDSGPIEERLTNTTNVTIAILDRNDNPPLFEEDVYTAFIFENSIPGDYVLTVNASDADSGSNAEFVFSLDFLGDVEAERNFVIDPINGTITLSPDANLDREMTSSYIIAINVTDLGTPSITSTTPLTIIVTDNNDNVPQFTAPFFEGSVSENQPPGTPVTNISATDADILQNGDIVYEIIGLTEGETACIASCGGQPFCQSLNSINVEIIPFIIAEETGAISTLQPLDRENISRYVLLVQASDSPVNETQLSNVTCVHVTVLDENDEYPQFTAPTFVANVSEYVTAGEVVTEVLAVDADIGTNAAVSYQLVTGSDRFTIHPMTGRIITLVDDFDREDQDLYNLTVIATDDGTPSLSNTAVVMVTILDENDNFPVFSEVVYLASVQENIQGAVVLQVNASDEDIGSNSELIYSIESSLPVSHFDIDPLLGVITTAQSLDRETFDFYTLTVAAVDNGVPSLTSRAQINVSVVDTNDHAPEFLGTPYSVDVAENLATQLPLLAISASDRDIGTNEDIFFSLSNVSPSTDSFILNETSGELYLIGSLNAEFSLLYNLTIEASNGQATPTQTSEVLAVVNVLDLNDNTPRFTQPDYNIPLSEASSIGNSVIQLVATDDDATAPNSDVTFAITGGFNTTLFAINSSTGVVFVAGTLDRESEPVHVLEVTVYDGGAPQLNSTTSLTVVLLDSNDNAPIFEQSFYSFSLEENAPPSFLVGTVTAQDLDQQNVSYSLPNNEHFFIDSSSGEIFTAVILDREAQEVYSFTAVASDGGVVVERVSEVTVNVTLLDQNDVPPMFVNSTYTVSWSENTSLDTVLLTVEAVDPDMVENGTVVYSILPGNDSSFFSINSTEGDVILEQSFDRETQDLFTIVISARDLGRPSLSGSTIVLISVLDDNDNVPMLNATQYTAILPEDSSVGTVVSYISASDLDIFENGIISFSLSEDFNGTFTIGAETGVLVLSKSLDYEFVQSYTFTVTARDNGTTPLSNSSNIFVEVVDLNDNPPIFDSQLYSISIPENTILNTPVFHIPATDSDSTSNSELRYSILSGNIRSMFTVDEIFGDVIVADYLDREINAFYSLSLQVVDLGTPQFTATAQLDVSILDVNDNPPVFDSKIYSVLVHESTDIGMSIFTVAATDSDIDSNANLTFSITDDNAFDAFDIDPITGVVLVNQSLDFESTPSYAVAIHVSDNGLPLSFFDTAVLLVQLLDVNEYPPFFHQSLYYVNISQNTVVGTPVGHFVATDGDTYSVGEISYSLVDGNFYFQVDSLEGTVYVSNVLTPGAFMLQLEATDGEFVTSLSIHVIVLPISVAMTMPLFRPPAFDFEISEMSRPGSVIGELGYNNAAILTNEVTDRFEVDNTGRVILTGSLDREMTAVYVLNVWVPSDTSDPLYAVMTITVLDSNDVAPVFESLEYTVSISELTPLQTTILTLRAYDGDEVGINTDFEIGLSVEGNEMGNFNLDPSTGALTVSRSLDYEVQRSFLLTANVTNHLASPQLYSTADILVSLVDENDNSPQFTDMIYQVQIQDSTPVGMDILVLEALDPDTGSNSDLVFAITHITVPLSFTINQTSGTIATNTTFNTAITLSYVISAMVSDRGSPQPRSGTTTIFVTITTTNMYPPQFTQSNGYSVVIPETLPIGASVAQISATDSDTPNDTLLLTYTIVSGDPENRFAIDPLTGLVTLSSSLDYDEQPFYSLTVQAADSGTPIRASSVTLNVSLTDINNHDPLFSQDVYEVAIFENTTEGSLVLQVLATDPDTVNITYQITENAYENGTQLFTINSTTGDIFTAASIDREFSDTLEILVSAIDSGYPIQRSRSTSVTFIVLDLNDNAPAFDQSEIIVPVVRLLSMGNTFGTVIATDADVVGEELTYTITADNSGGLFALNATTGELRTLDRLPETVDSYQLTVMAFDGVFMTAVPVRIQFINDGDFCEESGFCTSIREVNCTFDIPPFVECNPFCIGQYELSQGRRVCLSYSCLTSSLVPCVGMETCLPPNMACASVCPQGMSVCPTTNICHVTSLSESCDASNETCLVGQSLVQLSNGSRLCSDSLNLPATGQNCSERGFIYCQALNECQNISTPLLCQACPNELVLCADTGECVSDLIQCCGLNGNFCEVLNTCLPVGDRCELPNIAPELSADLIYLESITSFDPDDIFSGNGHVISLLLSNTLGTYPAMDSQGDELSIAIVEVLPLETSLGEWQYTQCEETASSVLGSCLNPYWVRIDMERVSQTNALLLPSSARIRFVRRAIELDGAVWVRAKLWDGNEDGYLSPRRDIVTDSQPRFESTLPFSDNGAFSENSTLLAVLVHPLIQPPMFGGIGRLEFTGLEEDVLFSGNHGNRVMDVVTSVNIPEFKVLSDEIVECFPTQNGNTLYYQQLLPSMVRERYLDEVRQVNPTRIERQSASESGQLPGIGVTLDNTLSTELGTWQVSLNGDERRFINLASVVGSNDLLLLNTTARLRFLPAAGYCGQSSILLRAWDGFWDESLARMLSNGYIVAPLLEGSTLPTLSDYNLNQWERAWLEIMCTPDKPVVQEKRVLLDPIPYRIKYRYERLFTVLVNRDVESLRNEESRFSDLLHLALQQPVVIQRFSPAVNDRTHVSFSIVNDVLSFEEVQNVLRDQQSVLAELNFDIINISQDASYGPGAGCLDESSQHYHGVNVNTFVTQYVTDDDGDLLGLAVVGMDTSGVQGAWQYHRGNWNISETNEYDENRSIWLNFPSLPLSSSNAFLLHGNDRLRFLPNPDSYWTTSPPALQVKIWDGTVGGIQLQPPASEVFTTNINTDPLIDTFQSLNSLLGLFSDDVMIIEASRYGCDGVVDSGLVHDVCCVCGGGGANCEGCDGVRGRNTRRDSCDICDSTANTCLGCDFIPFSGTGMGPCSECVSHILIPSTNETSYTNTSFIDCDNQCYGAALLDSCGVCSGGTTSHTFNSDMDCAGVCFGAAAIDFCDDCTLPYTFNQSMDCTGVCNGPYQSDSCGVCQLPRPSGGVFENRDCSGICFGEALLDSCGECYDGTTNTLVNSTVDLCGVCSGDNTSCIGCDGVTNSSQSIDSCGECGGNNCSCFGISSIYPSSGPRTGGTEVTVHGAGFFLNDTQQLQFQFDREQQNCGAPHRYPNDSSVVITCIFRSGQQQSEQRRAFAIAIDQSTVKCITEQTTSVDSEFSVLIQVANGPFSNPVSFFYEDYSNIIINEITPSSVPLNEPAVVTFTGSEFINSSFSACLVYNYQSCTDMTSSAPDPLVVPASYESNSSMSCLLPQSTVPCRVTVRLTFDGQPSGQIESDMTDFMVTYRHSAPRIELVHFSSDLSNLIVQFDRSVVATDDSTSLNCEEIFAEETYSLLGGSGASCYWTDDRQESMTVDVPRNAAVYVDSPITFRDGVLRTQGPMYSFTVSNTTVFVDSNLNAIRPIAILTGPSFIPSCGQVTFSGIDSMYPGYGSFEYLWSILVEDSSIHNFTNILSYLDTLDNSTSEITLNSVWFLASVEYHLQLTVVSSIGLQSEVQNLLLVKELSLFPLIRVVGPPQRELAAGEDLIVQSYVTNPDCFTPIGPFEFTWQLIRIIDERRNVTSEEDLSNVHAMSSEIIIPSSLLQHSANYIMTLTVSAEGLGSSSMAIDITVLPLATRAVIMGGNRTISSNRAIVLDARNSTLDPFITDVRFVWSCEVSGSFDACYNQSSTLGNSSIPVPILIPESQFIAIPGTDLTAGQTYVFRLAIQQGPYQSTASVVIELVSEIVPPIVEILVPDSQLVTSREIQLSGLVYSTQPVYQVSWQSVQLPGQGFVDLANSVVLRSQTVYSTPSEDLTSTPLPAALMLNQTSRANLILEPNVLQPGVTYTFRLAAVNIETNEEVGYAEVSINPDPAPHSLILLSNPLSGVAMETEFSLSVPSVVDDTVDFPLLYQYGIVQNYADISTSSVPDEEIQWISGIQSSSSFMTVLPSGDVTNNSSLAVLVRVFDRKGGFSDALTLVTVRHNAAADSIPFYIDSIMQIGNEFEQNKDWNRALSSLVSVLIEFDSNSNLQSQNFKQQSLDFFLNIFDNHLPPTKTHYILTSSILSLILNGYDTLDTNRQSRVINTLREAVQWFKNETVSESSFTDFPTQSSGEPLLLRDSYQLDSFELLSGPLTVQLLDPWLELLSISSSLQTSESFVQNIEAIATTLCQESTTGRVATLVETTPAKIYTLTTMPRGLFTTFSFIINFNDSLMELYQSTACTVDNGPCLESCLSSVVYDYDFLNSRPVEGSAELQVLPLDTSSQMKIRSEIEGSNPLSVELISDILSVSLPISSQNSFLQVRNLDSPIQILIPQMGPLPSLDYQPICLYREVGGSSGFNTPYTWQLDTTAAPLTQQVGSTSYYVCEYRHLSEFAIGLLPPPVITTPPPETTTPPLTTVPMTTQPAPTTEETPTTLAETAPSPPVAAIAIAIIIVLLIIAVVMTIVVVFVVWRKKRSKKVKIVPELNTSEAKEPVVATKAGPLTPEQSKVPMQVIKCTESGERSRVGMMNVLPSIRLRELRHQLVDAFTAYKGKPFYFLTRQLCDIEPAAEQQQFVSLVFADKPIFIREVGGENEQTRKHFCICGNAAQFECSNCSSQGYCSSECQMKHWSEQHQKECSRLAEKKKRSDILLRRQSTIGSDSTALSPTDDRPRRITLAAVSSSGTSGGPGSPTTPTNWKSFMSSSKSFHPAPPPAVGRARAQSVPAVSVPLPLRPAHTSTVTTLGELATRSPAPKMPQDEANTSSQTPKVSTALAPLIRTNLYTPRKSSQLPPLTRSTSLQQNIPPSSFNQPRTSLVIPNTAPANAAANYVPGRSSLQSPLRTQQPLFTRPVERQSLSLPRPAPSRHLSIQSVGSLDFNTSLNVSRDVRDEPLMESDEDEYEASSSTAHGSGSPSRTLQTSSRPPSLAVRKKRSVTSPPVAEVSSSDDTSSSSLSGEDSSDSSSEEDDGHVEKENDEQVKSSSGTERQTQVSMKEKGGTSELTEMPHDSTVQQTPEDRPLDSVDAIQVEGIKEVSSVASGEREDHT